jgi:4-alpha-glucanotransferase
MAWVSSLGGSLVGTLPILPSLFDDEFGPGPYMPASRLFWNEFYLDIEQIPELADCQAAQDLIDSPAFQKDLASLRRSRRVDYHDILNLKRSILETLAEAFFTSGSDRLAQYKHYVKTNEHLTDYARFRAAGEKHGVCWQDWPQRLRDGKLRKGDYEEKCEQYYLYTQWLAHEQLTALSEKARQNKTYLYLDVPVGVHPYSYDVWRERDSFATEVNAGAPPDPVFTSGQNWCFPPLHPEGIRRQGYKYYIQSLRHQMSQSGMLRIDHMMNLHRLFWIPKQMENRDGVYVGYRADEMYAILCLESSRNKTVIIGEDLGIVPPEVRPMMEKHGIFRMFVGQYELIAENQMGKIPSRAVAGLNTHDMFPFAAFWEELDIAERQKLKLIDSEMARKELEHRREIKRALISILQYHRLDNEISQDALATLKSVLSLLATSPAYALLVNMEDLWQETHPQNVPGTVRKQNWTQKVHCNFDQFARSPLILEILKLIDRERRGVASQ